ncbi:MAG: isocitrate lyase/phosphoenolpyruvate mutase family protein [Chloroflexota bacterium]
MSKVAQAEKAAVFHDLHQQEGAFVIPNPWDMGSARLLAGLGFKALATTSSGFAFTLGRMDGMVTLEEKLAHCRLLAAATAVPISADLENGFADDPQTAAQTYLRAAETGIVGGSIEDYNGEAIYDFNHAVERVQASVEAIKSLDFPFTLTARAENLIRGRMDLDDTIRRLQAFEAAGADVLYAPGLRSVDEVRLVTSAVSKPVNVLVSFVREATVAELGAAGAKRLSIGGSLALATINTILQSSREMVEPGAFGWMKELAGWGEVRRLL